MPFIIETTREFESSSTRSGSMTSRTRRAVATMDEVNDVAADIIDAQDTHTDRQSARSEWVHWIDKARDLDEPGTLGPLPNGAMVEVRHASWDDLVGPANWNASTTEAEVIAAFNEEQHA